jgi:hypothetical protein
VRETPAQELRRIRVGFNGIDQLGGFRQLDHTTSKFRSLMRGQTSLFHSPAPSQSDPEHRHCLSARPYYQVRS